MRALELPFNKCDVMLFGRELVEVRSSDGSIAYEPSYRTLEVADAAGIFFAGLSR